MVYSKTFEAVNVHTTDTLAKLLATENVTVHRSALAKTASFDLKGRILTLPILQVSKSKDISDMMTGHEVAHAIWTDMTKWGKAIDALIDISIAWKILGGLEKESVYYDTSLQTLERIREISERHNIPLRKDWDYYVGEVEIAAGNYQNAADSFGKYLKAVSLTSEEQANVKTQIGLAKAMLGDKEEGVKLLRECIETLSNPQNENIHLGKDVNVIWKTGAMMKLARVLDDRSEAI